MAGEESEQVGGISIGASIDDSQVDAGLNALLAKIEAAAKRLSGALTIQAGIGGAGGPAAAPRAAQPAAITFGAAARSDKGSETALMRRINEELAKSGEQLVDGVVVQVDAAKKQTASRVARAVQSSGASGPTSVPITLDAEMFREQFGQFLGELKGLFNEAGRIATISPQIEDDGPGGGGGRSKTARRKNIRDRAIGTEADQRRIYTFDPEVYAEQDARTEAKANSQRQAALSAHARRRTSVTDAEQRFLNALTGPSSVSANDERTMRELSYEAEREGAGARTSATLVPQRSAAEIAAAREAESRRVNQVRRPFTAGEQSELEQRRARATTGAAGQAIGQATLANVGLRGRGGGGGGRANALTSEDLARREEQQIAVSESQRLTAARTSRTFASGLGGFFLGQTRQQTEATVGLRRAEQELTIARRRLNDRDIIGNTRAYRQAQEEVAVAENKVAESLAKVQSFTGGVSAARTLASVTIAGAAFGLGLKTIDFAVAALSPAVGDLVDEMLGFSATSNRITTDLGKQTQAAWGNVDAVLAQAEAQAGLSASAADALDSQLRLGVQIKAGAQNAAAAGGLFRAAIGANQQAPAGLLGGYGGVLNGGLFAEQLGGGAGLAETIKSSFGDFSGAINALQDNLSVIPYGEGRNSDALRSRQFLTQQQIRAAETPLAERPEEIARLAKDRQAAESSLNEAAKRGAASLGTVSSAVVHFGTITEEQAKALQTTNLPQELKDLATQSREGLFDATGNLIDSYKEATEGLKQVGVGLSIPDVETYGRIALAQEQQRQRYAASELQAIRERQAFERPSILAAAERQQQFSLGTQLPAEAALQRLAAPTPPVGTGIVAANADEQERIAAGQQRSIELQGDLNAYYEQGRQVLIDTYKVPPALLGQVTSIGREIASLSAGIANEQAQYQVAQYNFQLQIARRTLSDIGGLTGKNFGAGESYLGVLERQNLALSRQAQLLQFALAQRQINFQLAVAGFQAPGITPEERQANVKEAEIEASFAQKQLDIQRQMFGNQVQIVDIQNLRQGADLAAQIGLLLQGRQVTLDTALAQEQIGRLQQQQTILVGQVGTYLTKVNNLTSVAFGQIQQLEAAAGRAMYSTAYSVLDAFGVVLTGLSSQLSGIGKGGNNAKQGSIPLASGGIFDINTPTRLGANGIVGEAGGETVAVVSHPRDLLGLGGTGGGGDMTVNFYGDLIIRDDADITKIAQAVMQALGTSAALRGLRLPG